MNEQIQFGIPPFRAFGAPFSPSRNRYVQGLLAFGYPEPRLPCAITVTLNTLSVTDISETQSSSRELGPLSPDGWCPAPTFPAHFGPRSRLPASPWRILTFWSVWAQLVRGLAVTGGKVGKWAPSTGSFHAGSERAARPVCGTPACDSQRYPSLSTSAFSDVPFSWKSVVVEIFVPEKSTMLPIRVFHFPSETRLLKV